MARGYGSCPRHWPFDISFKTSCRSGLGYFLLLELLKAARPTHLIQLTAPNEPLIINETDFNALCKEIPTPRVHHLTDSFGVEVAPISPLAPTPAVIKLTKAAAADLRN